MDEYTTAETAELLANVRPDRYTAGDISWADEVIDLLQGGQGVFGIALGRVWREVEGSLAELPSERADEDAAAATDATKAFFAQPDDVIIVQFEIVEIEALHEIPHGRACKVIPSSQHDAQIAVKGAHPPRRDPAQHRVDCARTLACNVL